MKFIVFGLGAIGTYIGVSLLRSGQDVVFIERPDSTLNLDELQLKLEINGNEFSVGHPKVAATVEDALGSADVDTFAIAAVKSFDTPVLASSLTGCGDRLRGVISFQNGVENEAVLAEAVGADKVIAGTLTSAVGRYGLGHVALERLRGIGLSGKHLSLPLLMDVMDKAGLRPSYYRDPAAMKWSKMLTNLLVNATSAILDMSPQEILDDPQAFNLETRQFRETLAVMRAYGYGIVDVPGTPVRALSFVMRWFPPALSRIILKNGIVKGRGAKMPSFHIDLSQGRKQLEVDYLNGAVVRAAQRVHLSAPVNRVLNETLAKIACGEYAWSDFKHAPERLYQSL